MMLVSIIRFFSPYFVVVMQNKSTAFPWLFISKGPASNNASFCPKLGVYVSVFLTCANRNVTE